MYYTCEEIAERFKVKKATVWGWIRCGRLPAARIGKLYRVSDEDLQNFIRSPDAKTGRKTPPHDGGGGKGDNYD